MKKVNIDQLMNVVLAPVVSEKSTFVADKNRQYVFRVNDRATSQIKAAVELMFKIKVDSVTVLNVKGKERRFGRTIGRKRSWKKAYVRLAEGNQLRRHGVTDASGKSKTDFTWPTSSGQGRHARVAQGRAALAAARRSRAAAAATTMAA